MSQDKSSANYQIRAYTTDSITINDTAYRHSLIISAETLICPWQPHSFDALTAKDLLPIVEMKPDIFILGTGQHFHLADPAILATLYEHNIGVECMDTYAACRTYMALISEDRSVAAGLILEETT